MRSSVAILVVAATTVCAGVAEAQLPLPTLDGEGPKVRIATDDPLADEIDSYLLELKARRAAREEATKKIQETLEARSMPPPDAPPDGTDKPELSRTDRERVERMVEREAELLAEAEALANEARAQAKIEVKPNAGPIAFEDLISQELTVGRLEDEAASAQSTAEQLVAVAVSASTDVPPGAPYDRILEAQEDALRIAEADLAEARRFDRAARLRLAQRRAEAWRGRVRVGAGELEGAKQALASAEAARVAGEQSITKERRALREAGLGVRTKGLPPDEVEVLRRAARTLRRERLDHLVRREEQLEVGVMLARARFLATKALAEGKTIVLSPELTGRAQARVAKVEQDRSSAEAQRAAVFDALRSAPKKAPLAKVLAARREILESDLALLLEMRQSLRVVETIDQIARSLSGPTVESRDFDTGLLLTVLVVLLVLVALRYGMAIIRGLLSRGAVVELLEGANLPSSRAEAVLMLVWPVAVLLVGGIVLVWPVWRLDLTVAEAFKSLARPLFFVESTGVSVFSVIQLVATIWVSLVVSRFTRAFMQSRVHKTFAWDIGLANAINTFVHYGIVGAGVLIGLRFVGIGASSFALVAGVLGIGIGFGLRNITENFISGLIILAERPVKIGDFIDLGGDLEGQVQTIRARSTTVVTRNNISVIIPNSEFVGRRVTNWSHGDPKVRVGIPVGVCYGSDTDLVRKTLLEVANRHGQVMKKPQPEVQFRAFGGSSLDFMLLVWIDEQQHRFRIASDLHFAVDKAFRKVGIEIAFPQLDLHFKTISRDVQHVVAPVPEPVSEEQPTMELPEPKRTRKPQ